MPAGLLLGPMGLWHRPPTPTPRPRASSTHSSPNSTACPSAQQSSLSAQGGRAPRGTDPRGSRTSGMGHNATKQSEGLVWCPAGGRGEASETKNSPRKSVSPPESLCPRPACPGPVRALTPQSSPALPDNSLKEAAAAAGHLAAVGPSASCKLGAHFPAKHVSP